MSGKRRRKAVGRALPPTALEQAARLLEQRQFAAVLRVLDGAFGATAQRVTQARIRAHALLGLGRAGDALGELRAATGLAPAEPALWVDLGQACFGVGDYAGAAQAFSAALERQPGVGPWMQARAVALQQCGELEDAESAYREALAVLPDESSLHYNLATVLKRLHRLGEAADAFAAARRITPDAGDLALAHGVCLVELGNFERAIEALEVARRLRHELPRTLGFMSYVYTKLQRGADAVAASREACRLVPDDATLISDLTSAEVAAGEWSSAIESADRALAAIPGDPSSLSNKIIALVEVGQKDEAVKLAARDRFVSAVQFEVPDGHADIGAFNQALLNHVLSHDGIALDLNSLSCHEGTTSGEILLPPLGPLSAFRRAIESAVERYSAALDPHDDHPFVRARPARMRMTAWLTVLRNQGYQHGHIHARAWLSGVYYLALPPGVGGGGDGQDGYIEFGRPPDYFPVAAEHPIEVLQPREGQAFLFPSYLYHRTIPFTTDAPRISIAFDFDPV